MSAAVQAKEQCVCWLQVRNEIWLCATCHRYYRGTQEFTSVSKVIRTVLPSSYDGVDPIVLEIARLRGVFVDTYFSEWLKDPLNVLAVSEVPEMIESEFPRDGAKHAEDTRQRIERLLDWWDKSGMKALAVQYTVYSETDGIAGTFDVGTDSHVIDLKCVSSLQPSYALQLGAYSCMSGWLPSMAILHVTKDRVKLVPYDAEKCKRHWRAAVEWFKARRELIGDPVPISNDDLI